MTHRGRDPQTGDWADQGTDWFRVTIWGDRAERAAEQFRKGNRVFVEGRFRTREYDAKDGTHRTSLEITADNVIPLERQSREDGDGEFAAAAPARTPAAAGAAPRAAGGAPAATPRAVAVAASTTPSSTTCPSEQPRPLTTITARPDRRASRRT